MSDTTPRAWLLTALAALLTAGLALMLLTERVEAAPAPTITIVSAALGPSVGSTAITIKGTDCVTGATVKFGTVAATKMHSSPPPRCRRRPRCRRARSTSR